MPVPLPAGTVTFLFSDVERSTALLDRLGATGYAVEIQRHRDLLRAACRDQGGVEIDTQGDAMFVAFASASASTPASRS